MSSDLIQVNYEQLEEAVRRFASCANTTETILSGLDRTMDDLHGGWEGEAPGASSTRWKGACCRACAASINP